MGPKKALTCVGEKVEKMRPVPKERKGGSERTLKKGQKPPFLFGGKEGAKRSLVSAPERKDPLKERTRAAEKARQGIHAKRKKKDNGGRKTAAAFSYSKKTRRVGKKGRLQRGQHALGKKKKKKNLIPPYPWKKRN